MKCYLASNDQSEEDCTEICKLADVTISEEGLCILFYLFILLYLYWVVGLLDSLLTLYGVFFTAFANLPLRCVELQFPLSPGSRSDKYLPGRNFP